MTRRLWFVVGGIFVLVAVLVIRNQIKVYNNRQLRAQAAQELAVSGEQIRRTLFDMLHRSPLLTATSSALARPTTAAT